MSEQVTIGTKIATDWDDELGTVEQTNGKLHLVRWIDGTITTEHEKRRNIDWKVQPPE